MAIKKANLGATTASLAKPVKKITLRETPLKKTGKVKSASSSLHAPVKTNFFDELKKISKASEDHQALDKLKKEFPNIRSASDFVKVIPIN